MPSIESILTDYGLIAVVIWTFIEGETCVIVGGFLSHQGYFSPYLLALAAFSGTFAGDQVWFYLGRRHSNLRLVQKVTEFPSFARVIRLIEQHPVKFIMTFRFVYGIRNIAPVALGLSRVSALKYFIFNMIAAIIWAICFTTLGYIFGEAAERMIGKIGGAQAKILLAVVVGFAIYLVFRLATKHWAKHTAARRARAAESKAAGE